MQLEHLHVAGYRSVRDLHLDLDRITVLVGPNGCGKTNLYRALRLLAVGASGQLGSALAEEGGLPSALWAGGRRRGQRAQIRVRARGPVLDYALVLGLPTSQGGWTDAEGNVRGSAFQRDPEVKEERVALRGAEGEGEVVVAERRRMSAWLVDAEGRRREHPLALDPWETLVASIQDARQYPELGELRRGLSSWRFYHGFRTDPHAPLREPRLGVRTTALGEEGGDLAAALQTIREIGDGKALHEAVARAFEGARLEIEERDGRLGVVLHQPGLGRALEAQELSDGTLRYLCLLAALLSPRPPTLLALNEPETSLHPDLVEPLAHALAAARERSQLWITTHSHALAGHLARLCGCSPVGLERIDGETRIARD